MRAEVSVKRAGRCLHALGFTYGSAWVRVLSVSARYNVDWRASVAYGFTYPCGVRTWEMREMT